MSVFFLKDPNCNLCCSAILSSPLKHACNTYVHFPNAPVLCLRSLRNLPAYLRQIQPHARLSVGIAVQQIPEILSVPPSSVMYSSPASETVSYELTALTARLGWRCGK
ncbi:hypothetical protein MVEN_00469400 [Mycena venus]|uniref:Uncharacterized protein n=1 Tax=Mycena venus TaxID=2733690 RepID=A0A8H6YW74_9AGAR|nr:hypothetical protein MVEN_00469400 [Mycena venus]